MKLAKTTGRGARQAAERLAALERRGGTALDQVMPAVRRIVADVRKRGDGALLRYAAKFDGLAGAEELRVRPQEMAAAWRALDPALRGALGTAAKQIRRFAKRQMPKSWSTSPVEGLMTGQLVRPLGSVGCYVPSGRHPLPSTLLMTVIPAQVAGVRQIRVASPRPAQATLAAAAFLGVREFYRVGGAQAVAALAYGTESIPRVDKIVGPGNRYVTAAKKLVAFDCAIEFLAGPTESVIISEDGEPAFIASDMVAQGEHDPHALCVFITNSNALAKAVQAEVQRRSRPNPIAAKSLSRRGAILLVASLDQAVETANRIAPEHLTLPAALVHAVTNAGSIFLNEFTPQAAGDYISGPNHVLPTGAIARVRGGLSVLDYVRVIACQEVSREGMRRIGPQAITLAEAEGLHGHAESLRVRCSHA